ncbi:MAG: aminoglycoside phosphotransferase family protein [Thermodesulfobacteriota bacterium]
MTPSNEDPNRLLVEQAADLAGRAGLKGPFALEPLPGGRNNRVYRLEAGGRPFLLKSYFRHRNDQRDRLGTEFGFIRFVWNRGQRAVPRPMAWDREANLGLYEFIEGRLLNPGQVTGEHVRQALDFCLAIDEMKNDPEALDLPEASESCFSLDEHLACVDRRLERLQDMEAGDPVSREAASFIAHELEVTWRRVREEVLKGGRVLLPGTDRRLTPEERCLSASDFGFHNALIQADGRPRFIDFEYAGWDDPAKMVCDFFSQPAVPVPLAFFSWFEEALAARFLEGEALKKRIRLVFPVHRIKWCCLMLNDFLPVGEERRRFAGRADQAERRKRQLDKVRIYLDETRRINRS